ncbi:MAG: prepilin-type N-terminal cleavage/methylation domain-containing protein [candidate division Zixibacteria bacterium]|nr:prepilin-type N-terminal cleavage/methylation domain-containing protein [candidate division Zixibacteria bacterium]
MKSHKSRTSGGFTLVELMITVVIIGIVTGMAVPKFNVTVDRMKMRSGVGRLTSDLRLARSMAISNKDQYGLLFDMSKRTITLFRDKISPASYSFEFGDSIVRVDTLPPEFLWIWSDCANQVVTFKPNGTSGFVGGGNVWALGLTQKVVCISWNSVLASTGRVQSNTYYY